MKQLYVYDKNTTEILTTLQNFTLNYKLFDKDFTTS